MRDECHLRGRHEVPIQDENQFKDKDPNTRRWDVVLRDGASLESVVMERNSEPGE